MHGKDGKINYWYDFVVCSFVGFRLFVCIYQRNDVNNEFISHLKVVISKGQKMKEKINLKFHSENYLKKKKKVKERMMIMMTILIKTPRNLFSRLL